MKIASTANAKSGIKTAAAYRPTCHCMSSSPSVGSGVQSNGSPFDRGSYERDGTGQLALVSRFDPTGNATSSRARGEIVKYVTASAPLQDPGGPTHRSVFPLVS